jgi:hypothetical protein
LLVLQSDWLVANVWAIGMSVETDASGPYWLCKSSTSKEGANGVAGTGRRRSERRFFADLWRSSQVMAGAALT